MTLLPTVPVIIEVPTGGAKDDDNTAAIAGTHTILSAIITPLHPLRAYSNYCLSCQLSGVIILPGGVIGGFILILLVVIISLGLWISCFSKQRSRHKSEWYSISKQDIITIFH